MILCVDEAIKRLQSLQISFIYERTSNAHDYMSTSRASRFRLVSGDKEGTITQIDTPLTRMTPHETNRRQMVIIAEASNMHSRAAKEEDLHERAKKYVEAAERASKALTENIIGSTDTFSYFGSIDFGDRRLILQYSSTAAENMKKSYREAGITFASIGMFDDAIATMEKAKKASQKIDASVEYRSGDYYTLGGIAQVFREMSEIRRSAGIELKMEVRKE